MSNKNRQHTSYFAGRVSHHFLTPCLHMNMWGSIRSSVRNYLVLKTNPLFVGSTRNFCPPMCYSKITLAGVVNLYLCSPIGCYLYSYFFFLIIRELLTPQCKLLSSSSLTLDISFQEDNLFCWNLSSNSDLDCWKSELSDRKCKAVNIPHP